MGGCLARKEVGCGLGGGGGENGDYAGEMTAEVRGWG
jgi:hypothetical protein